MIIKQRYDPTVAGPLDETQKHLRDAVWNRLSAGGIGLPGSITGVATLVMTGLPKKVEDALPELNAKIDMIQEKVSNGIPAESLNQIVQKCGLAEAQAYIQKTVLTFRNFEFFTLCPSMGLDPAAPVSCGAGSALLLASILLLTVWNIAVWHAYVDGPCHVTMPRRWFLLTCTSSVTAFVLFVDAVLIN